MTQPLNAPKVRVLGVGDNTVDIYRHLGTRFPGGNAVNVVVNVARLGNEGAYLGCVGDDANGRLILQALRAEGVDVSRCQIADGPTSQTLVDLVDGDRTFVGSNPGVRYDLTLSGDDYGYMQTFDFVHTSIYSGPESNMPKISEAATRLSFDFAQRWTATHLNDTLPFLNAAFLSAPGLSRTEVTDLAAQCAAMGPAMVVITRGGQEAIAWIQGDIEAVEPESVDVVDTLGAGDAFIARCLVGFVSKEPPSTLLRAATQWAAQTCMSYGGFGHGMPLEQTHDLGTKGSARDLL